MVVLPQTGNKKPGWAALLPTPQISGNQSTVALPSGAMLGLGMDVRMPKACVARRYQDSDFRLTDRLAGAAFRFFARSEGRRDDLFEPERTQRLPEHVYTY